ncbi:MAG: hypothetical protein H7070_04505 [Saprospiraceae bacterium]|nr:hypothetical protein [Pyrinomonadaceae bacterium]
MKITVIIILAFLGLIQSNQNCDRKIMNNSLTEATPTPKPAAKFDRLPENIKLETEVRKDIKNKEGKVISSDNTTVEKRLNELKAYYKEDKLVDGKGREIRFYDPICRGVSAGFEEDAQDRKDGDKELVELEKKYTVIVVLCDPRNVL